MVLAKSWGAKAALILCSVFLVFCQGGTAFADVNDFYFSDYEVQFYLERQEDGVSRMYVTEWLTAQFPLFDQNHGIVRIIPTTNQGGKNLVMDPNEISMGVLRNGAKEQASRAEGGRNYHEVRIGDPNAYVHGTQQYELSYAFDKVITEFGDWQELYWDTNGTGWEQRFEAVQATMFLDEAGQEGWTGEAWCYVGRQGENDQSRCKWLDTRDAVAFRTIGALEAGENMTIVLKFAPGTFVVPEVPKSHAAVWLFGVFVVATGIIAGFALVLWSRYKEKYLRWKRSFVSPEYQPLKDMSVGQAARLMVKGAVANSSITATVMELAVRGKLKVVQEKEGGALKKGEWQLYVVSTEGLTRSEALILEYLNGGSSVESESVIKIESRTATSALEKLYKEIGKKTEAELAAAGDMVKMDTKKGRPLSDSTKLIVGTVIYVVAWIGMCGASLALLEKIGVELVASWLLGVVFAVGVLAIIWLVERNIRVAKFVERTEKGLKDDIYLQGLRKYMKLAEAERIKVLQSVEGSGKIDMSDKKKLVKLYEKLLPYAVIFGMEKSWAKEMEPLYGDGVAPSWYVGMGVWSAMSFSNDMGGFSSATSSAVSSSGGSGSGGGGSSGGGGGGGGGGGW